MLNVELRSLAPREIARCVGCGATVPPVAGEILATFPDAPQHDWYDVLVLDITCRGDLENQIRYGGLK